MFNKHVMLIIINKYTRYITYSYLNTVEKKKNLIPWLFCMFAHWQRHNQSIILMIGLFVQWETELTKKIRKMHLKKVIHLICVLMSEMIFGPFTKHDLIHGGKTLVGNHRGQTFLVVGHQVCTHLRRDFVPLLFSDPLQVIKFSRLTFGNSNL